MKHLNRNTKERLLFSIMFKWCQIYLYFDKTKMALFEFLKLAFPAQRRYSETRCPAYGICSSVLHISCVNFCTESLIFIPHKIYVLPKVVRAKLPGPWEGGGCGGKKHPPNYIIWCFFFFEPGMWLSCSLPARVGIPHLPSTYLSCFNSDFKAVKGKVGPLNE